MTEFVDRWGELARMPIGRPVLRFPVGTLVSDVVIALAGRAEIECVFFGAGDQRISLPIAFNPDDSIRRGLEVMWLDYGWELAFTDEGQLRCTA